MTNDKYIKTILSANNEFRLNNSSLVLFDIYFRNVSIKIDSGCPYTTIPMQRLNMTRRYALEYKKRDADILIEKFKNLVKQGYSKADAINIERGRSFKISYGVERGGMKNIYPDLFDKASIMECEAISFKHKIDDLILGEQDKNEVLEYSLKNINVFINYDRKGNILLGMDILKDWEIHMGPIDTGETVFLACPKEQLTDEYFKELDNLFDMKNLFF